MLDIKLIRKNPERVKEALKRRYAEVDIDRLLGLDEKRRELIQETDMLRAEQKKASGREGGDRERARELKALLKEKGVKLEETVREFEALLYRLPNLAFDDVPEGKDERANKLIREVGELPRFAFEPKDYLTLAQELDLLDMKRAAKISGSRFGILKNEAVLLEFALVALALKTLGPKGFIPLVPPVLIKPAMMRGMGYIDTEADTQERYYLEKDKLFLVGTSEQAIGPMHKDEVFDEKELPRRYLAFSSCFRREAGSYGKDTKGILRVHQFDKVEMFVFCRPEESKKEHQLLLEMEEKLMQALKIPYRIMQLATGDLAQPSAATYDIEAWLPGQKQYRETHSCSNCTDFQARRLNIRYREKKGGKLAFVHTLNGTAFAIGRSLIAIVENYQQKDGSVKIPRVLQKETGLKVIRR